MLRGLKLFLIMGCCFIQSNAFNSEGHKTVAEIAFNNLTDEYQQLLLQTLQPFDLYTASTFADDIKHKNGSFEANWHFKDIPFPDALETNKAANLDYVTQSIVSYLKTGVSNEIINRVERYSKGENTEAILYAFLIHYVGDSSQPLHAATRVSKQQPKGDRGGNDFPLEYHYGVNELHALYDTLLYTLAHPINIPELAKNLTQVYQESITADDLLFAPTKWVKESHALAEPLYENITENSLPSEQYLALHRPTIEREIVLGGLRLSALIASIFRAEQAVNIVFLG